MFYKIHCIEREEELIGANKFTYYNVKEIKTDVEKAFPDWPISVGVLIELRRKVVIADGTNAISNKNKN